LNQDAHLRAGSWLDPLERPVLYWLAARLPQWTTPNIMTGVGFGGAVVTFAGYVLTPYAGWGLFLASFGYCINWFGDSLDGTLARHRGIARNRFGYFLDNGLDMVAQFLVSIGIGLSGLINWELCFLAFSILLMTSSLAYIRAGVSPVHKLAYGGVGLTEMRIVGISLNTLLFFVPPQTFGVLPMTYPNLLFLGWSALTLIIFGVSFVCQLRELSKEDPRPEPMD
jgi:phosphatidylglycerophosphate synthase